MSGESRLRVMVTHVGIPIGTAELAVRVYEPPARPAVMASGPLEALPAFGGVRRLLAPEPGGTTRQAASADTPAGVADGAPRLPLALLDERGAPLPAAWLVLYAEGAGAAVWVALGEAPAAVGAAVPPGRAGPGAGSRPDV